MVIDIIDVAITAIGIISIDVIEGVFITSLSSFTPTITVCTTVIIGALFGRM